MYIQGCCVYKNRTKKLDVKISNQIIRDGQTAKQLCLPQRSVKIKLAELNNK